MSEEPRTEPGTDLVPATHSGTLPPERVRQMFDRIARPYDAMNRAMTVGLDRRWRALAAEATGVGGGATVLDVCCGTGDLTVELARRVGPSGEVFGVDFSPRMLERARRKLDAAGFPRATLIEADALRLPLPDDRVAAATVGFGVRNLADLELGFRELARVVRPGGRVVCLEITTPESGPLAGFYRVWFDRLIPAVGRAVDRRGDSAYTYLPASVRRFPPPVELGHVMQSAGLVNVKYTTLAGGIVALHVGEVPL
jgi:demethylmenaquinone methyltransferase/2-methoxy-6-polyprenyl-1,4-benzoquinol methylase